MSEVVARTGVNAPTIRYYFGEGLLPPPLRVSSNRFVYNERHVEVIRVIRLLRERRGLPIETIRDVLPELLPELFDQPESRVFRPEMWTELLAARARGDRALSLRDRLIAVAVVEFSSRGYGEVSIEDIAKSAAIAKGSFYRHFASKEALFLAVVDVIGARIRNEVQTSGDPLLAVARLADLLAPHAPIVFDLSSLAARRQGAYGEALGQFLGSLASAAGERSEQPEASELLREALGLLVVRASTAAGDEQVGEASA